MTCSHFQARLDCLEPALAARTPADPGSGERAGSPERAARGLPADMAEHAASCPSCARVAAALGTALELYALPEAALLVDLAPRIEALLPFVPPPRREIAMGGWIGVGGLIIAGMVTAPLMAGYAAMRDLYGVGYTLPLALVSGLALSAYLGLFIASHLDGFSKAFYARFAK